MERGLSGGRDERRAVDDCGVRRQRFLCGVGRDRGQDRGLVLGVDSILERFVCGNGLQFTVRGFSDVVLDADLDQFRGGLGPLRLRAADARQSDGGDAGRFENVTPVETVVELFITHGYGLDYAESDVALTPERSHWFSVRVQSHAV
ncbi:hypothetical protein QA599_11615 [Haloarculaceae archaeon H-GB1-1]|nr:hypothetical protein [Haloarculaceae archaeon H-GB1-1]